MKTKYTETPSYPNNDHDDPDPNFKDSANWEKEEPNQSVLQLGRVRCKPSDRYTGFIQPESKASKYIPDARHSKWLEVEEAKRGTTDQIVKILDEDCEIRTSVFDELAWRRSRQLEGLGKLQLEAKNAGGLAFWPPVLEDATEETKEKAREVIKAEINDLYSDVRQNYIKIGKLLHGSLGHAKKIGDRLLHVKWHLLDHGQYEEWVEENFDGGLSTARAYTRIANYKNWKRLVEKGFFREG